MLRSSAVLSWVHPSLCRAACACAVVARCVAVGLSTLDPVGVLRILVSAAVCVSVFGGGVLES